MVDWAIDNYEGVGMRGIKRYHWNGDESAWGAAVLYTDHAAEIARLRAELQKAAAAALANMSLACQKEREADALRAEVEENEKAINVWRGRTQRAEAEADALRVDAERYRWLRDRSGSSLTPAEMQPAAWIEGPGNQFVESDWLTGERADHVIDEAMAADA